MQPRMWPLHMLLVSGGPGRRHPWHGRRVYTTEQALKGTSSSVERSPDLLSVLPTFHVGDASVRLVSLKSGTIRTYRGKPASAKSRTSMHCKENFASAEPSFTLRSALHEWACVAWDYLSSPPMEEKLFFFKFYFLQGWKILHLNFTSAK